MLIMKLITILFTLLFFSITSYSQVQNQNLECSTTYSGNSVGGVSIGCVSKASIERDKAQTRLLEIQIKLAEIQLRKAQKDEANQNPVVKQIQAETVIPTKKLPLPTPTPSDQ